MIRLSDTATLFHDDCRDVLRTLPSDSLDSCVTDPPYALVSMVKRFGKTSLQDDTQTSERSRTGADGMARMARGFMGKSWDTGETAFSVEFWAEVFRVLKPGAFVAAFGASRGYHRMACAIEDAGFEIRDSLMWIYGTGFPKSQNVAKFIDGLDATEARLNRRYQFTEWLVSVCSLTPSQMDSICQTNTMGRHWTDCRPNGKQPDVPTREYFECLRPHISGEVPAWVEQMVDERTVESENIKRREVMATKTYRRGDEGTWTEHTKNDGSLYASGEKEHVTSAAHTPAAQEFEGFGTALKPAFEPIVLARKPLSEPTVAANVLKWRTGALNIDGCRVPAPDVKAAAVPNRNNLKMFIGEGEGRGEGAYDMSKGRWPANVITDGSDEVVGMFPTTKSGLLRAGASAGAVNDVYGTRNGYVTTQESGGDSGSAARFFYSAKASRADRNGSKHPTVKPISLMQWLARLITPPGGTILDPFAGSGTTGAAARQEGFSVILCEREAEYVADIRRRLASPLASPQQVARIVVPRHAPPLADLAALQARLVRA